MLVKRLVEDLDRQMSEISAHEDALMGQVGNIYKYLFIHLFVHGTLLKINGKWPAMKCGEIICVDTNIEIDSGSNRANFLCFQNGSLDSAKNKAL